MISFLNFKVNRDEDKQNNHSQSFTAVLNWLKSEYQKAGITQQELSKKPDLAHSGVGKIELQERQIDLLEYGLH